jgi:tetrahydromethanopterin S-methyltransferase subunit F
MGIIPQQRTWPARPPQMLRQARWPKPRRAAKSADDLRVPKQKAARNRIRPGKPSNNLTGVIIAIVLMIVFAVVFIQLLSSLFSGIASIFA